MKLVDKHNNEAVIGNTYMSFRDEPMILQRITKPHKPSSTGRVLTDCGEFFPSVIGLRWIEREDH